MLVKRTFVDAAEFPVLGSLLPNAAAAFANETAS